jgi:hypothetical protein
MMLFRTIKSALETLLNNEAAGRFDVIGYQRQSKGAEETQKLVTVFYKSGNFPISASARYGATVKHEIEFSIEFTVSTPAEMDLSIIDNPASTPAERSAAIGAMITGAKIADDSIDELFDDVWNIILNPINADFQLNQFEIQDRWIDDITKDEAQPRGELIILTGRARLTCTAEEIPGGETPTPAEIFDSTIDIESDQGNNAGASGDLGG